MDNRVQTLTQDRYRITPPFERCLRGSIRLVVPFAAVLLALIAADLWWGDRPIPQGDRGKMFAEALVVVPLAILVVAGFLYGAGRVLPVSATRDGLVQHFPIGRSLIVPWSMVTRVTRAAFHGVPTLLIWSSASKRAVVLYMCCLDFDEVHDRLVRLAGPDHIVTLCFATGRSA